MKFDNLSWKQFEAGRDYNRRIGYYENSARNERFYRGDQWSRLSGGQLPTPIFNFIRRITDYLISQVAVNSVDIVYSDENLPFVADPVLKERISAAIELVNRNASYRWEKCRLDRLLRQVLLDAAISGDGVFFTYWDSSIVTGQAYTGDFVTTALDGADLIVADVNSTDIQSQEYIIVSGRESVNSLRAEALDNGVSPKEVEKLVSDDAVGGAGDCSLLETDCDGGKATYIIKFYRNREGFVCFEKSTEHCFIRSALTGLRLYPIAMFNWIPTKGSFHGTSPITPLIHNQKYVNKAYALLMKHMIDSAFSKVVYDKTRVPEWTNEVGQAIGVVGGNLDGVAATISPGEMDSDYTAVIDSVIRQTKDMMGATESSLGEVSPNNTSAILALQEANSVTLDSVRSSLYAALEELAEIWIDFMCAYYADGRMLISGDKSTLGSIDGRMLRGELIRARVDIGSGARYSGSQAVGLLQNLLDGGHITLRQYLERLPDGVMPMRERLLEELSESSESASAAEPTGSEPSDTDAPPPIPLGAAAPTAETAPLDTAASLDATAPLEPSSEAPESTEATA